MKFTKTAAAVAVAAFAATPMFATADTTLSGVVEIQLSGFDVDDDAATPDVDESEPGDATIGADDVLFGISTDHEINLGLTGYGNLRVDINRLSNEGRTTIDPGTPGNDEDDVEVTTLGSVDSVYVGIKGGFGDVRFGEVPVAVEYGQVANDIFDVAGDVNGGVSYVGNYGPVGVIANFAPDNNEDVFGVGAKFDFAGVSLGAGFEDRADVEAFAFGGSYSIFGASIGAHYWTRENGADDDIESVSGILGYGFAGVSAQLTISSQSNDDDSIDQEAIRLDLSYGLGGGMTVSTRITDSTDNADADNDQTSWRIKLSKSF